MIPSSILILAINRDIILAIGTLLNGNWQRAPGMEAGRLLPTSEVAVICTAAVRNGCTGDNYLILLAIRKAENGGPGKEFGVKHPKAWGTNLDTQAGWAAATIVKHRKRQPDLQGRAFIDNLADRYCPPSCDPVGNKSWKRNVWYWYQRMSK